MRKYLWASVLTALACSTSPDSVDLGSPPETTTDIRTPEAVVQEALAPDLAEVKRPEETMGFETVEPDIAPDIPVRQCEAGEGCFLDKCAENSDCQSGWCVEHMGEGVCTVACTEECQQGWACKQAGGGPDLVYVCVSNHSNLCKPCNQTDDCKAVGGAEDVCVDYGDEGAFCGGMCETNEDCPWGFSCQDTTTVDGILTAQCVAEAGVCPCTGKSVSLSLWTACANSNEFGTCHGKRVCDENGLTDCDALVATPETCDGIDNDCDDETDEPDLVQGAYLPLCDDLNDCTEDKCLGETGCVNDPLDEGECTDGNPCTVADHCTGGSCLGDQVECDDDNPCTDNVCVDTGGCEYPPIAGECDDSDPCTLGDHCLEGECVGESVACTCQDLNDCAVLEDGDKCNGSLICDTSALPYECAVDPATVIACPEPEGPHTACLAASCDMPTGYCSIVPTNEGVPCDDGNACNYNDVCTNGECTGGPAANCNDGNECTDDSCDAELGCEHTDNAAPCTDGDVCTTGDQCSAGQCIGGPTLECDDDDLCNGQEACDAAVGCVPGETLSCDDGNECNGQEICHPQKGCVAGNDPICDDDNPCTDDLCVDGQGCLFSPNQAQCDDGNECTTGDHCDNSACTYDSLVDCDDDDVCTDSSCDPAVGCVTILNSAPCDDDDLCTYGDQCELGECKGAGEIVCNDGNVCTDDSCDAKAGCQFTPNNDDCDDANECTLNDKCSSGWCLPGPPPDCNDQNLCTDDSCVPDTGCVNDFNTVPCTDNDECTVNDVCAGGQCAIGPDLNCNDSDPCTDDSCNPETGCEYVHNQAECSDGNECTLGDSCDTGICVPGVAAVCGDENVCTDDSCDPVTGCVFAANDDSCDDDDECTVGDFCDNKACNPGPGELPCDDSSDCTNDSCDPDSGCVNTPVQNGTPCLPDGKCTDGVCVPDVVDSCQTVLANAPNSPSGVYKLDPDGPGGDAPFDAWCDMTQDDGGWTLVMSINTADGIKSFMSHSVWTTHDQYGNFANRWSTEFKSHAAMTVSGTALLLIVRNHNAAEGAAPVGWRSWNLDGSKKFQDFFDVSIGAYNANASGGCNSGHGGDGRKQTSGILSSGVKAPYDTFTGWATNIYTNSYYGNCEASGDGFRLSSWYRWANNSNVGLGLQMDGKNTGYCLEAGSHMTWDAYGNPQRYCTNPCNQCTAYPDGNYSYTHTKAAIGTDHNGNHCTVGVSYRYEWYVR